MKNNNIDFVFFGTPGFSVDILKALESENLVPKLVVTTPDRERGRGQKQQSTPVAGWAKKHRIETWKPEAVDDGFLKKLKARAPQDGWDVFVVVAYGKILPEGLIYLPKRNTLNVPPSLLPKVRGPAPIRGTILKADNAGVTIIELDELMDHGPIIAQEKVKTEQWPPRYDDLKPRLAKAGGTLLADILPRWMSGDIDATPQSHDQATYIEKFKASDGRIDFGDDPKHNLRKIRAFTDWPKAHFFKGDTRVVITKAHIEDGTLKIDRVKPEGENEMSYRAFTE